MSENFNDILAEIKKIKGNFLAFSPSHHEDVEIKPLTLAQQKMIIESSVDTNLSVLFFNTTFYNILQQNLSKPMSQFDTIDRVNFAISLRHQLQDVIKIDNADYSLETVLRSNRAKEAYPTHAIIESTQFKFHVKVPNLEHDNKINNILLRKYKDESLNGSKLKSLISDMFSYEIFKFIVAIEIQSTGKTLELQNNTSRGIELIESIDSKEFIKVIDFINKVRDVEKSYTKIPDTNVHINILPDFFIV